jgi:hypothetical protein
MEAKQEAADTRPLYKRGKWMSQTLIKVVFVLTLLLTGVFELDLPDLAITVLASAVAGGQVAYQLVQGKVDQARIERG